VRPCPQSRGRRQAASARPARTRVQGTSFLLLPLLSPISLTCTGTDRALVSVVAAAVAAAGVVGLAGVADAGAAEGDAGDRAPHRQHARALDSAVCLVVSVSLSLSLLLDVTDMCV
jgi:hypothetical protein